MRIVFIGDIIGSPGREALRLFLSELIVNEKPGIIIANAENSAGGKGITGHVAAEIFDLGVDVITLGNHSFDRKGNESVFINPRVLRPANYPEAVPGIGYGVFETKEGYKLAVVNIMGRVYLPAIDCPFSKVNSILKEIYPQTKNIFVDFHAEVTSEKLAMGCYLDGRVSAVIGTHTHVQTADDKIMPGGTAYLTDAGMTGPVNSIIGMERDIVIKRFLTAMPQHFIIASGPVVIQGCIVDVDTTSGKATEIRRFSITEKESKIF